MSQLDLSLEAGVSARHLSFVETGRSRPSAEMVLHLSEQLDVPLRARNDLLLAAGYAPVYEERSFDAPELGPVRDAVDAILRVHEPYPAAVVDRHWELLAGNAGIALLVAGVAPDLLAPPANVLRISLHPDGMAPRIANLGVWRAHLLERLGRQVALSGDPQLATLHEELLAYPGGDHEHVVPRDGSEIAVPLRLRSDHGELAFISTVTTFGTAIDITAAELSIEAFYPADPHTASVVRSQAAA
jgi:transcriptional regulator with XRE-family HTH domain